MVHKLISEQVCLRDYPKPYNQKLVRSEITKGDTHGNALNLIYLLIRENILDISPESYQKLIEIYTKEPFDLSKQDIKAFTEIINNAKANNRDTLIRFLGDETCDRGKNDYFTLLVLNKLKMENIKYNVLLSNHGIGFVEAYETRDKFYYPGIAQGQSCSMEHMQMLIEDKVISREDVLKLVNDAYKPALQIISYSLDTNNNTIRIFSHAPIGIEVLIVLADKFSVPFDDKNIHSLARTIDEINRRFAVLVKENKVHTLYDSASIGRNYSVEANLDSIIDALIWNRDYKILSRPHKYRDFNINWVHGHDSRGPTNENCTNLDNNLGKSRWVPGVDEDGIETYNYQHHLIGEYSVLYTNENQLNPKPENLNEVKQEYFPAPTGRAYSHSFESINDSESKSISDSEMLSLSDSDMDSDNNGNENDFLLPVAEREEKLEAEFDRSNPLIPRCAFFDIGEEKESEEDDNRQMNHNTNEATNPQRFFPSSLIEEKKEDAFEETDEYIILG